MHFIMAYLNFVSDVMISDQKQKGQKMGALLIETVWRNSIGSSLISGPQAFGHG